MPSARVMSRFSAPARITIDRKSTRLNSSHANIWNAVFCLKKANTVEVLERAVGPFPVDIATHDRKARPLRLLIQGAHLDLKTKLLNSSHVNIPHAVFC